IYKTIILPVVLCGCEIWSPIRNAYRIFVGKPERKRPLEDTLKMDLREIECDGMDWIDLAQDRDHWRALVNMVMNLRVP
ncbi:hypothetical protein B7P43_G03642, partial [Cryptotermes secundus]